MNQMQFKFEPGYVASLRQELDRIDVSTLGLSKEQIVALASMPDSSPAEYVEAVGVEEVEELPSGESFGFCIMRPMTHEGPLHYKIFDNRIVVGVGPQHGWTRSTFGEPINDAGLKFAPDMSIMMKDGAPVFTHSGTGTLFDITARMRDPQYDNYVISLGYEVPEILNFLVAEHKKAGAPVTALLQETTRGSAFIDTPELVRSSGSVVLLDPRDMPEKLEGRRLISMNTYVVSAEALKKGMKWTYRRRRYHQNNQVWYQFERDLHEITHQYLTNYVQL